MNKGHPFTKENGWSNLHTQKYDGKTIQYVKHDNYRKNPATPKPAVGWYVQIKGRYYGDLLVVDNDKLQQAQTNSQAIKDAVILLQDQAQRTIDQLKADEEKRNKEKDHDEA